MYLINQLVEFDPEKKRVTNRRTGEHVQLQLPASLCFLYLITHRNEIASQNTLMHVGWGKRNEVTTANTFYQSILTLRNALEHVELPRETVKTLSRRGLMLAGEITVEDIESAPLASQEGSEESGRVSKKPKWTRSPGQLMCLAGLWAGIAAIWLAGYLSRAERPFQDYIPASFHPGLATACEIYHPANESLSIENISLLNKHPEFCKDGNHLFVFGQRKAEHMALFVCNKDARNEEIASCLSYYYWTKE